MQVEITDANGNKLDGTATLNVRVVLPDVGPVEPPVDPTPPDPPVVEPEPTPPPTWEQFRSNKFGPWPEPPAPGVFRWEADALKWLGACRVVLSKTSVQTGLATDIDFIQAKGTADSFALLSNINKANRTSTELWQAGRFKTGGVIDDPTTWPGFNLTDADITVFDLPNFKKDYTQVHGYRLPDGSLLFGTRSDYDTGTTWQTGTVPWIGRRLPDGSIQTLALPGYNPQAFGGGFALIDDTVYLGRGGYLSGQPPAAGPAMLRLKLADLLAWLEAGKAPAGFEAKIQIVANYVWGKPDQPEKTHHRPPDYVNELKGWAPDPTPDMGYWTIAGMTGNPCVMDRGFLWFVTHGDRLWYTPPEQGRRTMVDNPLRRALVIDPYDYDRVAAGEIEPWQVRGKWYGAANVLPPSIVPICASYDKVTRTLFVASNVPGSNFLQAIHAFEVL